MHWFCAKEAHDNQMYEYKVGSNCDKVDILTQSNLRGSISDGIPEMPFE